MPDFFGMKLLQCLKNSTSEDHKGNITCQDRFVLFHKQCALVNNELPTEEVIIPLEEKHDKKGTRKRIPFDFH